MTFWLFLALAYLSLWLFWLEKRGQAEYEEI